MDYAENGILTKYDPEDIADAAEWEGDPQTFLDAMINCGPGVVAGFIERKGDELIVHDWEEYIGRLLEKKAQNKERKAKSRSNTKRDGNVTDADVTQESQGCHAGVSRDGRVTGEVCHRDVTRESQENNAPVKDVSQGCHALVTRDMNVTNALVTGLPYLTVPNQTEPKKEKYFAQPADAHTLLPPEGGASPAEPPDMEESPPEDKKARKAKPPTEYHEAFLRFWNLYPRRVDKERAYAAWKQIRAPDRECVIVAARNYAAEMRRLDKEAEFIRHPKTFLGKNGWEDWVTGPPGAEPRGATDAEKKAIIAKYTDREGQRDDMAIYRELKALERERGVKSVDP
jgi:hypothetical protein